MTIDIDAILDLANAATPGPWYPHAHPDGLSWWIQPSNEDSFFIGPNDNEQSNAEFIAAARQYVPALCAEVRELRTANEDWNEYSEILRLEVHRIKNKLALQDAALERARALLAEQAEIITANVWHIPPEYSARNIVMDAAAKMRELAALLAAAPGGAELDAALSDLTMRPRTGAGGGPHVD